MTLLCYTTLRKSPQFITNCSTGALVRRAHPAVGQGSYPKYRNVTPKEEKEESARSVGGEENDWPTVIEVHAQTGWFQLRCTIIMG